MPSKPASAPKDPARSAAGKKAWITRRKREARKESARLSRLRKKKEKQEQREREAQEEAGRDQQKEEKEEKEEQKEEQKETEEGQKEKEKEKEKEEQEQEQEQEEQEEVKGKRKEKQKEKQKEKEKENASPTSKGKGKANPTPKGKEKEKEKGKEKQKEKASPTPKGKEKEKQKEMQKQKENPKPKETGGRAGPAKKRTKAESGGKNKAKKEDLTIDLARSMTEMDKLREACSQISGHSLEESYNAMVQASPTLAAFFGELLGGDGQGDTVADKFTTVMLLSALVNSGDQTVSQFPLFLGTYLKSQGLPEECLDVLNHLGYCESSEAVSRHTEKIQKEDPVGLSEFLKRGPL